MSVKKQVRLHAKIKHEVKSGFSARWVACTRRLCPSQCNLSHAIWLFKRLSVWGILSCFKYSFLIARRDHVSAKSNLLRSWWISQTLSMWCQKQSAESLFIFIVTLGLLARGQAKVPSALNMFPFTLDANRTEHLMQVK